MAAGAPILRHSAAAASPTGPSPVIIIALVPLALRGVPYRPIGAEAFLRRNLLIYGLGGIVARFIGIKLIDLLITHIGLA